MEKTHIILDFKSDLRTGGTNNEPSIHYPKVVSFEKLQIKKYFMRLENVKIPTSFYQVNSTNNTLIFRERNSGDLTVNTITVSLPESNYTIGELATELTTIMTANSAQGTAYTVEESDKTGKLSISYSGGAVVNLDLLSWSGGNLMAPIIGAGEYNGSDDFIGIQGTGTELPNAVNLNYIDYINLQLNVVSQNHLTTFGYSRVGVRVPITEARGDVVNYANDNGYKIAIRVNTFSEISAVCYDSYNNLIDFQGVPFSFQLVVYELEPNGL